MKKLENYFIKTAEIFLIEQYREYGNNQILGNKIKKCGICYDVNLKFENEIKNAIQIEFLIFNSGKIETEKRTYLYEKQNGIYKIWKTAHKMG